MQRLRAEWPAQPAMFSVVAVRGLLAAAAAALLAAVAIAESPSHGGCSLDPSILVFHKQRHTNGSEQIQRAAELGFQRVNIVVTLHAEIDADNRVQRFGVYEHDRFAPLDAERLTKFRTHLQGVFAAAVKHDLKIAVVAHLNSGGRIHEWRNYFDFDPLAEYGGYAYRDAVIESIVAGLAAANAPGPIEFSIAGEMGRSVSAYPESYATIIQQLKQDVRLPSLQVGVSLNFNHPEGERTPTAQQCQDLERLLTDCDFLGMSHYRWFDLPPDAGDFANAVEQFYVQLDFPGVKAHRSKPLHFTEVGLGGGREDGSPATTPEEAAATPWQGTDQASLSSWRTVAMRQLRVDYHRALLEFLANPPPQLSMTGAYLWTEGSWDPLDIVDSGFYDAEIAELIREHNRRLLSGGKLE